MSFDSGEVLPGLNEPWTFMGANAMEWAVGIVVFILIGSLARTPASAMPLMIFGWVMTTATLASIRKMHPDEERGVRNALMTSAGFAPPGIPAPASLQPKWSATPLRKLDEESKFCKFGLDQIYPSFKRDLTDVEV